MFTKRIGIDLGTANTLVFLPNKGIVINEPSVVAISEADKKVVAIGTAAKEMLGRTPEGIRAEYPLRDGVIADYKTTEAMLNYFINKATGILQLVKPELVIAVPAGVTSTERRAVIEAAARVGAKEAFVVKEPIVAALGAEVKINEPSGNMIVDIGGGTTEVAIISLSGIVTYESARVGGRKFDEALAHYVRKTHNLDIGARTAEEIKIAIGRALTLPDEAEEILEIRGRDLIEGLPKTIEVSSRETPTAFDEQLQEVIHAIKQVLQKTPPELAADIMDKGIVMTGGASLLKNLDKHITAQTGVPAYVADNASLCVAKGCGIMLNKIDRYKNALMTKQTGYK